MFIGLKLFSLTSSLLSITLTFIWVVLRSTFPRYRYDILINIAWKSYLPQRFIYLNTCNQFNYICKIFFSFINGFPLITGLVLRERSLKIHFTWIFIGVNFNLYANTYFRPNRNTSGVFLDYPNFITEMKNYGKDEGLLSPLDRWYFCIYCLRGSGC